MRLAGEWMVKSSEGKRKVELASRSLVGVVVRCDEL